MRVVFCALFLTLSSGLNASADVFDVFEKLQPINQVMTECLPEMVFGDDSCCNGSIFGDSCTNNCCVCPPAPTMIGASLGSPYRVSNSFLGSFSFPNFYSRIADNNSAIPQNRVYTTTEFYNDVEVGRNILTGNTDRDMLFNTVGMESTFADGNLSAELIIPYSYSPGTNFTQAAIVATDPSSQMQLQNIAFGFKALLTQDDTRAISAGVRFEAPTAKDIQFHNPVFSGELENTAWSITPYLAILRNINDDTFFQAFMAYRMQTSEDYVTVLGTPVQSVREPAYFDLDAQLGHWMYRNHGGTGLTGLQAKIELHYTGMYEAATPQTFSPFSLIRNYAGERDILNLTTGVTALFNDNATLTLGMVNPLRNGSPSLLAPAITTPTDRLFDYAIVMQFNYYFGNN